MSRSVMPLAASCATSSSRSWSLRVTASRPGLPTTSHLGSKRLGPVANTSRAAPERGDREVGELGGGADQAEIAMTLGGRQQRSPVAGGARPDADGPRCCDGRDRFVSEPVEFFGGTPTRTQIGGEGEVRNRAHDRADVTRLRRREEGVVDRRRSAPCRVDCRRGPRAEAGVHRSGRVAPRAGALRPRRPLPMPRGTRPTG